MAKSLQEQLLASGVARPKQAKKAQREKAASNKAARQKGQKPAADDAMQRELAAAEAAKRERDRQLNAQRKTARAARERDHAMAQIIARHRVKIEGGQDAVAYSYTDGRRIRRIYVSETQRRELAAGRLAIVRHSDRVSLVPKSIAERLREEMPERVWLVTLDDNTADTRAADDPYAEYPVPDDLMW